MPKYQILNKFISWQRIGSINLDKMEEFAATIAQDVKKGDVITLTGDLGAGKTTFAQFFIKALSGDNPVEVTSPTFNLLHLYETSKGEIWHFDLYRLKQKEEIYELGLEEAFLNGISLIEWPQIIADMLPSSRLEINLEFDKNSANRNIAWRYSIPTSD